MANEKPTESSSSTQPKNLLVSGPIQEVRPENSQPPPAVDPKANIHPTLLIESEDPSQRPRGKK